jgi:peptidoglycan hydrolase CwlO-like protein
MFVSCLVASLCCSCVSKKKYESLARAKRVADREVSMLLEERDALAGKVTSMQQEFNASRYLLTENNAEKDKQIDELYGKLRAQETQGSALKSELKDAEEQARYVAQSTSQRVASLEERLRTVVAERDEARKQLAELKNTLEWDNRKLKGEVERLTTEHATKDAHIKELNAEIKALKGQLELERKALEEQPATR